MAERACLELGGLVVKRRRAGRAGERGCRVALQAKNIDIAHFEHVRVGRTMGHMAG